jgi:hypothetical protein
MAMACGTALYQTSATQLACMHQAWTPCQYHRLLPRIARKPDHAHNPSPYMACIHLAQFTAPQQSPQHGMLLPSYAPKEDPMDRARRLMAKMNRKVATAAVCTAGSHHHHHHSSVLSVVGCACAHCLWFVAHWQGRVGQGCAHARAWAAHGTPTSHGLRRSLICAVVMAGGAGPGHRAAGLEGPVRV